MAVDIPREVSGIGRTMRQAQLRNSKSLRAGPPNKRDLMPSRSAYQGNTMSTAAPGAVARPLNGAPAVDTVRGSNPVAWFEQQRSIAKQKLQQQIFGDPSLSPQEANQAFAAGSANIDHQTNKQIAAATGKREYAQDDGSGGMPEDTMGAAGFEREAEDWKGYMPAGMSGDVAKLSNQYDDQRDVVRRKWSGKLQNKAARTAFDEMMFGDVGAEEGRVGDPGIFDKGMRRDMKNFAGTETAVRNTFDAIAQKAKEAEARGDKFFEHNGRRMTTEHPLGFDPKRFLRQTFGGKKAINWEKNVDYGSENERKARELFDKVYGQKYGPEALMGYGFIDPETGEQLTMDQGSGFKNPAADKATAEYLTWAGNKPGKARTLGKAIMKSGGDVENFLKFSSAAKKAETRQNKSSNKLNSAYEKVLGKATSSGNPRTTRATGPGAVARRTQAQKAVAAGKKWRAASAAQSRAKSSPGGKRITPAEKKQNVAAGKKAAVAVAKKAPPKKAPPKKKKK